jgi:O-antigen/teichoic acid export membrane protein
LETIFRNLYLLIIGKIFSPTDLGFYSRAYAFQQLPIDNISSSIWRVTYPVFSSMQEDRIRLKLGIQKALTTASILIFPMMVGLAVVAKPLILIMLTEKWLPCVPYLQLLCFVGILYPLHMISMNVLAAQGRSDLLLQCSVFEKAVLIIAILVTYRWGIPAMIYGQIASSLISYCLNCFYVSKLINYTLAEQVSDLFPILLLSSVMGAGIYFFTYISFFNQITLLVMQIVCGTIFYFFLCRIFRLSAFMEIIKIIRPKVMEIFRFI